MFIHMVIMLMTLLLLLLPATGFLKTRESHANRLSRDSLHISTASSGREHASKQGPADVLSWVGRRMGVSFTTLLKVSKNRNVFVCTKNERKYFCISALKRSQY